MNNILVNCRLREKVPHDFQPFLNLQQLYEFEFSRVTGYELNADALYDRDELLSHWSKVGVDICLAYCDRSPIGFCVVNLSSMLSGDPETKDIAEFFVMPSYRKKGVGKWMAHKIFNNYKCKWEVRQLRGLNAATSFWRKVIDDFTFGSFMERDLIDESWDGLVQYFENNK